MDPKEKLAKVREELRGTDKELEAILDLLLELPVDELVRTIDEIMDYFETLDPDTGVMIHSNTELKVN